MPIGTVPPPSKHPDEPPIVCIPVNRDWIPIILGALQPLKYPEYWGGTLEENRRARKDFGILLNQIMLLEDCGMASECCEDIIYIYQINPVTGRFERSSDDGETWTTDPSDPLHVIVRQPPLPDRTGLSLKCDASTNFLEHFEDIITACSENIGTAITIFELTAAVVAVIIDIIIAIVTEGAGLPMIVAMETAIFSAANAAFQAGKTAFDDYWDNDKKDKVLCAALCTIGDNGQFTDAQWNAFRAKVKVDLPAGAARDFVLTAVNAGGSIGASNMASYGAAATADCSGCIECLPCNNKWAVFGAAHGTITAVTDEYIEIEASDGGNGNYYVIIKTPDPDICCSVDSYERVGGGDFGLHGWTDCGQTQTVGAPQHTGLGFGTCVNYLQAQDATPFTVRFFMVDCP